MMWSPSVRLYTSTSENADNLVQRKPGNNLLSRKPFLDRSVNSKTPDTGKLLKQKCVTKVSATLDKQNKSPKDDLNSEEFAFSFKEMQDTYNDIWPRLKRESLVKILHNYCSTGDTPPPSPEPIPDINPIFFELPTVEIPQLIDDDNWNKTFDVELPECELDISV